MNPNFNLKKNWGGGGEGIRGGGNRGRGGGLE